jgi:hypothetical protein
MQFLKTFVSVSFSIFFLTACGGSDSKKEEKKEDKTGTEEVKPADNGAATKLEGAWEIKRAEGEMAKMNMGTVYEFKGSKLSFGKDGYKNPGKTEVTDSTFTFQADGNELKFDYIYKFNGDTLVVRMKNGAGQVFHMVKQ